MKLFEIATHQPTTITSEPKDGIWFRHESPKKLSILKPQTYASIKKSRDSKYPIDDRKEIEDTYRKLVDNTSSKSFLYATLVNYNKMESPKAYPGYTYYFQLTKEQINQCIFDLIDKKEWMKPKAGKLGLKKAMELWDNNKSKFKKYKDSDIGIIYPRVEVIIPIDIIPKFVYPQEEDR